ncbi:hypothetical protein ZOSMA_270G00220 [Zostera marina]|uniref:Uncharacterized protein n=1 Tax=Zostera marina TaxID=29655 RepID=A0A0K9PE67_ZOSMR|nr:hypothetical protein ZOSMA_270G00220 [Zostera marina]
MKIEEDEKKMNFFSEQCERFESVHKYKFCYLRKYLDLLNS